MRKGRFMLDLSSIQEKHNEKYLTLEHLRAFIYKAKLNGNKTKGKNEQSFYGVTCAKDALFLLQEAKNSGISISCFKQITTLGISKEVDYSEVEDYLKYLIILDDESNYRINSISQTLQEFYFSQKNHNYLNIEFLFIRKEIENIINAKIPYFKNLSDITEVNLIPLNTGNDGVFSDVHDTIEKLKSELEEKDKKIAELQALLDDKNAPILLGVHRNDDPLKIAIEVRNKYWANYPDNVKSNAQIRNYIIRDYGVTQTLATEIEKIACPINRKKN